MFLQFLSELCSVASTQPLKVDKPNNATNLNISMQSANESVIDTQEHVVQPLCEELIKVLDTQLKGVRGILGGPALAAGEGEAADALSLRQSVGGQAMIINSQ